MIRILQLILSRLGISTGALGGFAVFMTDKTAVAILACLCAAHPAQALAQGTDEGGLFEAVPVVVGASRFEQPTAEAPSSITVVTDEEIRRHGWRTLEEIIANVRGFTVSSDRNYGTLGFRGFARGGDYNSRLLLLVDGVRINGNVYGEADYGRGGIIDTELIDRIEFVRGPGSSVYGSSAFFGVINIISKRGRDLAGTQLRAETGSHRATTLGARSGRRLETGLEYAVSASGFGERGEHAMYLPQFDTPGTGGVVTDGDGERARRFFAKFRIEGWTLTAMHVERDKVVPTAAYGTAFGDTRLRTQDERSVLDLQYRQSFAGGTELLLRASANTTEFRGVYPFVPASLNRDRAVGNWWSSEAVLSTHLGASHRLTAGIERQDNTRIHQSNFDTVQRLADTRSNATWGAFIQDEWRLGESLLVNAGVRHDHYPNFGATTNPRLGLVTRLHRDHVVKLLMGRAFRAPNAYEMYYSDGGVIQGTNPNLRPERIQSNELVLESRLSPQLSFTGNVYYNHIDNFIQQVVDPASGLLVFQNLGDLRTRGWETEAQWRLEQGGQLRAAYSRQRTRDALTGARIAGSPTWTSKLGYSQPFGPRQLSAGVSARLMSSRLTLAGNTLAATAVADANLRWRPEVLQGATLSLGVLNLFNRQYMDPGGQEHAQDAIAQSGRLWRLQWEQPL